MVPSSLLSLLLRLYMYFVLSSEAADRSIVKKTMFLFVTSCNLERFLSVLDGFISFAFMLYDQSGPVLKPYTLDWYWILRQGTKRPVILVCDAVAKC